MWGGLPQGKEGGAEFSPASAWQGGRIGPIKTATNRENNDERQPPPGENRPQGNGTERLRRRRGELLRSRRSRRGVRLAHLSRHTVELEGSRLLRAAAGPALHAGQNGGDPG